MKQKDITWKTILNILLIAGIVLGSLLSTVAVFEKYNIARTQSTQSISQHCVFNQCQYTEPGTPKDFANRMLVVLTPVAFMAFMCWVLMVFVEIKRRH